MKAPSFYCENCGNPVSLKADNCPSCGRSFESVKCPECSFAGKADLFVDGCPSCGYLSTAASSAISGNLGIMEVDLADTGAARSMGSADRATRRKPLPAWAYAIITVGLIGFLIFLLVVYLTLE